MPDPSQPDFSAWSPAVTNVPGQGPQHDISAIYRKVINPFLEMSRDKGMDLPPCAVSRALVEAAQVARNRTFERLRKTLDTGDGILGALGIGSSDAYLEMQIFRDLLDLQDRLQAYRDALDTCDDMHDESPPVLAGMYRTAYGPATARDPEGKDKHFADLAVPFMIDNQVSALAESRRDTQDYFWRALSEAILELPDTIWTGVEAAGAAIKGAAEEATERLADATIGGAKDWLADLGRYLVYGGVGLVVIAGVVYGVRIAAERRRARAAMPMGPAGNPYVPPHVHRGYAA